MIKFVLIVVDFVLGQIKKESQQMYNVMNYRFYTTGSDECVEEFIVVFFLINYILNVKINYIFTLIFILLTALQ